MWERACSRRQCVGQNIQRLTHRFREQARTHFGIALSNDGSRSASQGASSINCATIGWKKPYT
ncbi:hypothetical protein CDH05_18735 [Pseudomonas lactis]|nr:hypothetical protein CDH05_18735 [Pseudomonas lactis]